MPVYDFILAKVARNEKLFTLLIDPDRLEINKIPGFIEYADKAGVDMFFIGSSFLMSNHFDAYIGEIKEHTSKPVVVFPGNPRQISGKADALLFLSVISGRNPEHLIGSHVEAAPVIRQLGLETIPTGYMLVESGKLTAAQYMNHSFPLPRDKAGLAITHALAGQYLGLKLIYLEAGSGALYSVPEEMVSGVKKYIDIPLIVGGGIKSPGEAAAKIKAGADIVVIGNHFEEKKNREEIKKFSDAIHSL